MSRRFVAGIFATALVAIGASGNVAQAGGGEAAASDKAEVAAFATDFDALLGFVGGIALTTSERQLVVKQTAMEFRGDPATVRGSDLKVRKFLATLHKGDPSFAGAQRESIRLQMAMLPADDPARRSIERHDPTVVFDRAHKRLITEATLSALQRACTWLTGFVGVPGPDRDFVAKERTFLQTRYKSLPDAQQDAFAHVERDLPVSMAAFKQANPAKMAQWAEGARAYAHDRTQLAPRTVGVLADTYAVVERQNMDNSIMLMSNFNYNGLYHSGYYQHY